MYTDRVFMWYMGVLGVLCVVGIVAVSLTQAPAPTCPGECCPCDAVDAHVVAKWLERSGNAALACNGKWRYFQVIDKDDTVILFVGEEIGELGDAPASIGEMGDDDTDTGEVGQEGDE